MEINESNLSTNNSIKSNENEASAWSDTCVESIMGLLEEPPDPGHVSRLRSDEKYDGFDSNMGDTWIYPSNLPLRNYQYNITKVALFKNTLAVLPTGLGKTFIAAVVMYNIYRWYPKGKVIFMAPTRPLVAQQINACKKIMGIPISDTAEMTGKQNKRLRQELWQSKRVFFATPQVVQIDISDAEQNFPFKAIKLIVIDEAHKAKGRYAYTEVIQAMVAQNLNFRILALSATPGRRIEDVTEVIRNLFISHIEVRWENSIDVMPYTHKKNVKTIVVPLGEELNEIRNHLIEIIDPYVRNLIDSGVLSGNVTNLSRGWIVMEAKRFRDSSVNQRHPNHSTINTDFSICISLYHALELLERHGIRVFLNFFDDTSDSSAQEKFYVALNPKLKALIDKIRKNVGPNPFAVNDQTMTNGIVPCIPENIDFGHPKYTIAKKCLLEHFEKNKDSKVIVFCEYRESVMLMHRLLLQCRPLIKPKKFVGQGGTGSIRAVTQKEQIEIMKDFRSGAINTLIATSVAEEGIDVGEVDLIICFDISTRNPTRLIQRIGRTGRQRQGHVIMLASEGKEHGLVKEVLATKDKINQKLANNKAIQQMLYKNSPRIVPPEYNPKCIETFMQNTEIEEIKNTLKRKPKETSSSPAKRRKTIKNSQPIAGVDVRKFFKKIDLDEEEKEIFSSGKENLPKNNAIKGNISAIQTLSLTDDEDDSSNIDNADRLLREGPSNTKEYKSLFKKINLLGRNLDQPMKTNKINLNNIIKSDKYDNVVKRYILRTDLNYIKEKFDAFQAVNALSNSEDDQVTDEGVTELKSQYKAIEDIFGKYSIESLISKNESKINQRKIVSEKFHDLFDGFQQQSFSDNISDFVQKQFENIEIENTIIEHDFLNDRSIINDEISSHIDDDSVSYDEINSVEICSKYASQFIEVNESKMDKQSTPLRNNFIKNPCNLYQDSPLMNAFAKSLGDKQTFNFKANISIHEKETPLSKNNDIVTDAYVNKNAASSYLSPIKTNITKPNLTKSTFNFTSSKGEIEENNTNYFDDDFDDIIKENSDLLTQMENNRSKQPPDHINKQESTFLNESGIPIEDILYIVTEKEKEIAQETKSSAKKSEIEDINDLIDAIDNDDDFDEFISPSQQTKEKQVKNNKFVHKLNSTISSNSINKNYLTNKVEKVENSSKKNAQLENTPKTEKNKTDTSPSLFRSALKLKTLHQISSSLSSNVQNNSKFVSNCVNSQTPVRNRSYANIRNSLQELQKSLTKTNVSESLDESIIQGGGKRFRCVIESSDSESEIHSSNEMPLQLERLPKKTKRNVKRRRCEFIDDEAEDSGQNTDDNEDGLTQGIVDSLIDLDGTVDDHPDLNMHAKYLQSIRSPKRGGPFKIPPARKYMDLSKICSQPVFQESLSAYKEDSFVLSDDDTVQDGEVTELCPLEQAEAILKARRKARKKKISRRIVYNLEDESSEDDL